MSEQNQKTLREMLDSLEESFAARLKGEYQRGHSDLIVDMRRSLGLPNDWPAPTGWLDYFRDVIKAAKESTSFKANAESQIAKLTSRIHEIAKERQDAFAQVTLKSQEWMNERDKLTLKNRELSGENDYLRSQVEGMKRTYDADVKRRCDALRKELRYAGESGQALKDADAKIEALTSENVSLRQAFKTAEDANEASRKEVWGLREERRRLNGEIERLHDVAQSLRVNLGAMRKERDGANELLEVRTKEVQQIAAILGIKS